MSSTEFRVNQRDLEFVLFEQLRVQDLDAPRYADYGQDLYEMILNEAIKIAEETLGPINATGDRTGCKLVDGQVITPQGYKEAYKEFTQAGWTTLTTPTEYGGQGLPRAIALATVEIFTGACCAFVMYPGLTQAGSNLMRRFGTPFMKEHLLPKDSRWVSSPGTDRFTAAVPSQGAVFG